ncbi:NUDIX hydrolase [Mucilaginibacter sp. X4EP1]|uniref:NUDIX hydrolase n=1 Tax=Mucilaginibacter sp. X4EP1 TaxID=2723092 RepID=UPI00216AA5FE|nr:NUDIX domain-containing protein [Mucilaginibacter sp. X4EP1]MCS3814029.1 ADP-ribose pyrophosphatase YjhB (NUDIX family) [Mucilaginibacter sp. X4EP1]
MEELEEIRYFFNEGYKEYRPNLTLDCAIFGYHEGELKLLLVKNKIITKWCLPGGYFKQTESLDDAAARITEERTGLKGLFLKQFKAFSKPGRNATQAWFDQDKFFELTGIKLISESWLSGETVSIGFYAITDIVNATPKGDFISSECRWFPVDDLPDLAFDHNEIAADALFSMRIDLYHFPIGKNLLQPKFTLKEIKTLYEVLSGKTLNATNFPNKLIALNLISKLDEKRKIGAHRSPTFYAFNDEVYEKALKEGLVLV